MRCRVKKTAPNATTEGVAGSGSSRVVIPTIVTAANMQICLTPSATCVSINLEPGLSLFRRLIRCGRRRQRVTTFSKLPKPAARRQFTATFHGVGDFFLIDA